jgi:(2S)-methylsuccinyl-CoA dehydrogenase
MMLSWVTKDELVHAAAILGTGLARVSDLARRLARSVTVDGRVSADLLDRRQLVSFELAQTAAELQAAHALLVYAQDVGTGRAQGVADLEAGLALVFAAEALQNATSRVLARPEEYGLSEEETGALAHDRDLRTFVRRTLAVERLEALGERVAQEQGQVGEDVLGEDHALMRSTFRKVAEQVVKPLAESVHREDRIIPPEILQSLTDLGAFGLSIPERYGGLQPDDGEDSLGMIVVTEELSRGSLGAAGSLITRPEIVSRSLLAGEPRNRRKRGCRASRRETRFVPWR